MGLASCKTPGMFTGPDIFEQLLQLQFEGVSGNVAFDEEGNRAFEGMAYRVDNLLISANRSDTLSYRFESSLAAVLRGGNVTQVNPFLFNHGENQYTIAIPSPIPPVEENFNFIPQWATILGCCLGSSIMLLSLLIMAWTWWKKDSFVIKAAQPPFLMQLCFGTLVGSAAVFPLSLHGGGSDESTNHLKYDRACISTVWLLFLGFVISFSAISAKTLRLNKLMNAGQHIRRVKIEPKDVMKSFVILMTINVVLLTAMTLVAPMEFRRTKVDSVDAFGRSIESYGACRASSSLTFAIFAPLAIANTIGVGLAGWQCYVARHLPMDFSETRFIGISMASLSETLILSMPVLFALEDQPSAYFLFASVAVCFLCLSILVPVFLPKWIQRNQKANLGRAQANLLAQCNHGQGRRKLTHTPSSFQPATNGLSVAYVYDSDCDSDGLADCDSTRGVMKINRYNSKPSKSSMVGL